MKFPGYIWTLIYAAATAGLIAATNVIEQALRLDYADWVWAPIALAVLGAIAKWVEIRAEELSTDRSLNRSTQRSKMERFFLG